ncbi:hypothetical protein TNCV_3166891 [Trichonephila clavipes]|uniref:Reverse transcriptase/retrotransposon-derived protein RNase H-like domain-containing protein n=1 Tax=Trichonephila clavipes TaxID=2585209 RepID=A0A8X6V144_TRICX|nr:hypothetical protein TNCV_3166891 [Trichonephila clavipes]
MIQDPKGTGAPSTFTYSITNRVFVSKKGLDGVLIQRPLETSYTSAPVPYEPFSIHSDALQIGIAACLSQACGDKSYPFTYTSPN